MATSRCHMQSTKEHFSRWNGTPRSTSTQRTNWQPKTAFLVAAGAAATAAAGLPLWATPRAAAAPTPKSAAETAVKALYDTLTPDQKKAVCFAWDHQDPKRGLLRTHVANNWHIVPQTVRSEFYTQKQQHILHDIYKGLLNPEWVAKFDRQTRDDNGGKPWGTFQNVAIFGQ